MAICRFHLSAEYLLGLIHHPCKHSTEIYGLESLHGVLRSSQLKNRNLGICVIFMLAVLGQDMVPQAEVNVVSDSTTRSKFAEGVSVPSSM